MYALFWKTSWSYDHYCFAFIGLHDYCIFCSEFFGLASLSHTVVFFVEGFGG
jgi:hypothetical protein